MFTDPKKINYWFFLCWLVVSCWLLISAFLTHGEYGDGYHAIVNGRYLFGDSPGYIAARGPFAALAMWPVEFFIDLTEWNPIDIRPYHFYSALLHSLYLLGCWILLKLIVPGQSTYAGIAQLLAFVAAILSVVFYAFAPFLNHDILPGFLFLLLIFLCHRWLNKPTIKMALLLVIIGTLVTLIKQTYALFWVIIIIYALLAYALRWDNQRVTGRKLSILIALAFVSGISSWLGWGIWLAGVLPEEHLIIRPWLMINMISEAYAPDDQLAPFFSQDLYLRNLHNYGLGVVLLIVPGIINAYNSKNSCLKMIAVCWLLSVSFMQLITFKEVRYLLFLAPMSAVLIVPVIEAIIRRRIFAIILVLLIFVDQSRGWTLAAKQIVSTVGINVTRFLDAPDNKGRVIFSTVLSFIYIADSPLNRDTYHGIYHITGLHFDLLLEKKMDVVYLENPQKLGLIIRPGDRVYWANVRSLRSPPWSTINNEPGNADHLQLISGDAVQIQLVRKNDQYIIKNNKGQSIMFVSNINIDQQVQAPVITSFGLTVEQAQLLYGDLQGKENLNVTAVIVKGLCRPEQCIYDDQ